MFRISRAVKVKPIFSRQRIGNIRKPNYAKGHVVFFCSECAKDEELNFKGVFLIGFIGKVNYNFKKGCACSKSFSYSKRGVRVVLSREAKKRGYEFIGFVNDEYASLMKTKIILKCPKHGEWSSCTAANFIRSRNCPLCAKSVRPNKRIIDKTEMLLEMAEECGYSIHEGLHPKVRNRDKLSVICNKGHQFLISVENFRYGRRCPTCRGKNMNILYINKVDGEVNGKTLIKVGITKNLDHRIATQNNKNKIKFSLWQAWKFNSAKDCKECESRFKSTLTRPSGVNLKDIFKDGHSEEQLYYATEEIIGDYKTLKYIPDKVLSDFIYEMFKDNIVK